MPTPPRAEPAVMASASLFSASARTSLTPKGHTESEYAFLDRSARAQIVRVRELLDAWYARLPVAARASIRNRFASADLGVHRGALLELYLHEAFHRLELEVDIDVGREDAGRRRPDFLIGESGEGFYVEATAAVGANLLGDKSASARAAAMQECIAKVHAPNFWLGVQLEACGTNTPGRREVRVPLQRWLDELDPDEVLAEHGRTGELPSYTLRLDDWEVECQAFPVSPEHRGDPDHEVIGAYGEGAAMIDDAKALRRKLKHKASHYEGLERPYVVCLLCAGDFADDKDVGDALLGSVAVRYNPTTRETIWVRQADGIWHGPHGPRNTTVSAVITIPQLSCSSVTAVQPTLWLNPWAARPLTAELPWRTNVISPQGRITTREASRTPADLFGLPERWPVEA